MRILLPLSALAGLFYCVALFAPGFVAGTSPFWQDPHGVVPDSWADMQTALSGYDYFVRDTWRWPLFQVGKLGAPAGADIIFTDSAPVLALLGRVLFRVTGHALNLFGVWTVSCFVAAGVSMVLLVAGLGARSLAACLAATVFGLCMPALLARWGHLSLMAQFEVVLALALYVHGTRRERPLPLLLWSFPLGLLALWTHAYLFAMVAPIIAAAIVQAWIDRRLSLRGACLVIGILALLAPLALASGYLSGKADLGAVGYGVFSANPASLFVPQESTLFPLLGRHMLDATGGQREGFCYLGGGGLLLLGSAWPWLRGRAAEALRSHFWLVLVIIACTAFAVSDEVYFGVWHITRVPLPATVLTLAGVFRASGRFIWPAMYLLAALGITGCAAAYGRGRAGALLLIVAACLQWIDTAALRHDVAAGISAPTTPPLDIAAWEAATSQASFVRVLPSFACSEQAPIPVLKAMMQVQLIAGRENVATNSFYSARSIRDCRVAAAHSEPDTLTLYWLGDPDLSVPLMPDAPCAVAENMAVCGGRLSVAERARLLPAGTRGDGRLTAARSSPGLLAGAAGTEPPRPRTDQP